MKGREFGVDVQYKYGVKLVGERTRKPLRGRVTKLLFADDAVATGTDRDGMKLAAKEFGEASEVLGLDTKSCKD